MKVTNEMVTRFLTWRLPEHFRPDCYVVFDPERAKRNNQWPVGTNLLDAEQAREMLEHVIGKPSSDPLDFPCKEYYQNYA